MIDPLVRTVFDMLRGEPAPETSRDAWDWIIAFCDRTQLTLHLRGIPGLPDSVAEQLETRLTKNRKRRERLLEDFAKIARALDTAGIEFVLLKGFTHEIDFRIDPGARVQYDLDLLCKPVDLAAARKALQARGYVPHSKTSLSDEHVAPLVRPFDWQWRGDYFDPDMPIPVELHSSIWDAAHDRIPIDTDQFWNHRTTMQAAGLRIPSLSDIDRAGFASLHVLRHVLRNDARPAHAFELAQFLIAQKENHHLWARWQETHDLRLRMFEAAGFRLALEWFGKAENLPLAVSFQPRIENWFQGFAWSPISNLSEPNKDAVWLHLALLNNWTDRSYVFGRRLLPLRLPHGSDRFSSRLRYHAAALAPALLSGFRFCRGSVSASTAAQMSDWNRRRV